MTLMAEHDPRRSAAAGAGGPMIDFEQARETMVESQLRTAGVFDRKLLGAMRSLPREIFVAPESRALAYMDGAVPLGFGEAPEARYLMQPMALAKLIQAAAIAPGERVLDVGCGSGYSAAVLAKLAGVVVALESDPELAKKAEENLASLDISNTKVVVGALAAGAAADGPYDLVFLDGSVPAIPAGLIAQVKEGGRIAGIVSHQSQGTAYLFVKLDGEIGGLPQFAVGAKPLPGFGQQPAFSF
jgi:protein-L-isoaspartate(D-aspartate) O-methyltransferase